MRVYISMVTPLNYGISDELWDISRHKNGKDCSQNLQNYIYKKKKEEYPSV